MVTERTLTTTLLLPYSLGNDGCPRRDRVGPPAYPVGVPDMPVPHPLIRTRTRIRFGLSLAACALLTGCTTMVVTPVSEVPTTTPTSWNQVTDGTWAYGDYGLGQSVTSPSSEYAITVTGPPTLTSRDGSTVTMTSPLTITRTHDLGNGASMIPTTQHLFFAPGPGDTTNNQSETSAPVPRSPARTTSRPLAR